MDKAETSERWDGYFYLFLGRGKHPRDAAMLADDALMEWRLRHDLPKAGSLPKSKSGEGFEEFRNVDSSKPPDGSIFYTNLSDETDEPDE